MIVARLLSGVLMLVIGFASAESFGADKTPPKKPLVRMYDRNGDGKLGPKESIAARPTRAQLRQARALRRNAAVIGGNR